MDACLHVFGDQKLTSTVFTLFIEAGVLLNLAILGSLASQPALGITCAQLWYLCFLFKCKPHARAPKMAVERGPLVFPPGVTTLNKSPFSALTITYCLIGLLRMGGPA